MQFFGMVILIVGFVLLFGLKSNTKGDDWFRLVSFILCLVFGGLLFMIGSVS